MPTLRVGLIGLPATAKGGRTAWSFNGHLPCLLNLHDYQIVALANSSVEAARRSISEHGLPPATAAYGTPEDIAKDPHVDLIVVCVQVQKHYDLVKPAMMAGKKVLVEWPLAANMRQVEELTSIANKSGVQSVVGLQARASPVVACIKDIISSGKIGKVVSSTAIGTAAGIVLDTYPEEMQIYVDLHSGGNMLSIVFGHFLDTFVDILGDLDDSIQSTFKTQFLTCAIRGLDGTIKVQEYQKTAPDQIFVQGNTKDNIAASFAFRACKALADDDARVRWIISGTEGEICIETPRFWQGMHLGGTVRLRTVEDTETKNIDLKNYQIGGFEFVPEIAANVASLYDAIAKENGQKYATFEEAAKTHRLLERIRAAAGPDWA